MPYQAQNFASGTKPLATDTERQLEVKMLNALNASSGSGSGTVTTFSAGDLSPLFTSSVADATSTPALSFALSAQNANKVFAGPTTGADAAPTFRALVDADLGTGLTPQFLRLGIGQAADATVKLAVTGISAGATINVFVAKLTVPTSNPYIAIGDAANDSGAYLGYDRSGNVAVFGIYGHSGFQVSATGLVSSPVGFDVAGTPGATGSFDATNTVSVVGGIITGWV